MKKILLIMIAATLSSSLFAQNIMLSDEHGAIASGSTILVLGDPMDDEIIAELDVKNNSSSEMEIGCFRRQLNFASDSSWSQFCWVVCYAPFVDTASLTHTLAAGETISDFSGHYHSMQAIGSSRVTYVFYDVANMGDSTTVTIEYKASPAGIGEDLLSQVRISNAYPNPAKNVAYFDYTLPDGVQEATMVISNLLGAVVKTIDVANGDSRVMVNTSDLKNGLYICSMEVQNNVVMTRKMIVNH